MLCETFTEFQVLFNQGMFDLLNEYFRAFDGKRSKFTIGNIFDNELSVGSKIHNDEGKAF
jgi:hypothetical protein